MANAVLDGTIVRWFGVLHSRPARVSVNVDGARRGDGSASAAWVVAGSIDERGIFETLAEGGMLLRLGPQSRIQNSPLRSKG